MRPRTALIGLLVVLAASRVWAASPQSEALAKARLLYNERHYDQAIEAAEKALSAPALADSARVVIGRSYLERFRQSSNEADLEAGRNALRQVQSATLTPRDRADLLIGLGESLYLDNAFGAASDLFSSAIGASGSVPRDVRDSVLDWWASSMDHLALQRPADEREDIYYEIVTRMQEELVYDPASAPASYWLAAAARGSGDLDQAWDAALAGWVRALLSPAHGPALRADLDHLVRTAIIDERASEAANREVERLARPPAEREKVYKTTVDQVTAELQKAWEGFKAAWK